MIRKVYSYLAFLLLLSSCQFERQFEGLKDIATYESFQQLAEPHQLNLLRLGEAGQSLELCLTLMDGNLGTPLKRKRVEIFQANAKGDYLWEVPGDKSSAKLHGQVLTDDQGRIFLKTLLPGDFGSNINNRVIHLKVEGAAPSQLNLHFCQFANSSLQEEIKVSEGMFLVDLMQDARSNLIGIQTLNIGKPAPQNMANSELPRCEWCGTDEAPSNLSFSTIIAKGEEPGRRIVLTGTVFEEDGYTPAKDVIIYAYHTNAIGLYDKKGNETGNGKRHGYLRGWVKTNSKGQYKFSTIKPAPYPSRVEPAHIHMTLKAPGRPEYWIQSTLFKGDPLISVEDRIDPEASHVIDFKEGDDGILYGIRDIILSQPKS